MHRKGRDDKNFNAFLSAIEKVHFKENLHVAANLDQPGHCQQQQQQQNQSVPYVLNNSVYVSSGNLADHGTSNNNSNTTNGSTSSGGSKPDLIKKHNIDVICNDLHGEPPSSHSPPSSSRSEDMDYVESSSDISSTDTPGEWDLSSGSDYEELTKEELASLAEYTAGYALTRYTCLPHECPQCLSTYYSHLLTSCDSQTDWFRVEIVDSNGGVINKATVPQEEADVVEDSCGAEYPIVVTGQGKVEVSLAGLQHQSEVCGSDTRRARATDAYINPNAVMVDLTDSEITFTVSNHTSIPGTSTHQPPRIYPDLCHNFYYTMFGYIPQFVPYYLVPPPTFYNPYAMVSVPRPLCLPRDLQCLHSRRLCMVPAFEVENCKHQNLVLQLVFWVELQVCKSLLLFGYSISLYRNMVLLGKAVHKFTPGEMIMAPFRANEDG